MKKQLFAVIAGAALALPMLAKAQAENIYVGANVGNSELTLRAPDLTAEQSKTSYKVYAGYDFNTNFGAEIGYADFGSLRIDDHTSLLKADTTALYAAATATLPLNTQFALFGKLGVTRNRVKFEESSVGFKQRGKQNKTSALIGFGLSYKISKNLAAVAEYENFGETFKNAGAVTMKSHTMSAGLRYKF